MYSSSLWNSFLIVIEGCGFWGRKDFWGSRGLRGFWVEERFWGFRECVGFVEGGSEGDSIDLWEVGRS